MIVRKLAVAAVCGGFFLAAPGAWGQVHCNPHTEEPVKYGHNWHCRKIAQTHGSAFDPSHGSSSGDDRSPKANRGNHGGRYPGDH